LANGFARGNDHRWVALFAGRGQTQPCAARTSLDPMAHPSGRRDKHGRIPRTIAGV
jgi:hypothetical protein